VEGQAGRRTDLWSERLAKEQAGGVDRLVERQAGEGQSS
jgi:hypothetical protein